MEERYITQLKNQLKYIENSCKAFDSGQLEEGIRLSMCFRIIFHNTNASTSLLRHLGKENIKIVSSAENTDTGEYKIAFLESLVQFNANGMFPKLGNGNLNAYKPMLSHDWWEETILVSNGQYDYTRRKLILHVANKDGGGHVDSVLPEDYKTLKEGDWFFVKGGEEGGSTTRYNTKHLFYLRQIAWEVLNSPELTSLVS